MEGERADGPAAPAESGTSEVFAQLWADVMGILVDPATAWKLPKECTSRGREAGEKNQDHSYETPTCSAPSNSGVPNTGKDMDLLEQVQKKDAKMVRGMGHLSFEEKANRLELFCLEEGSG
ncbi:hypothetical protein TURU_065583 [Turdus rufiventris]|nr:hypothetical protein TURU_065583 [Turdus rufiventris]